MFRRQITLHHSDRDLTFLMEKARTIKDFNQIMALWRPTRTAPDLEMAGQRSNRMGTALVRMVTVTMRQGGRQ